MRCKRLPLPSATETTTSHLRATETTTSPRLVFLLLLLRRKGCSSSLVKSTGWSTSWPGFLGQRHRAVLQWSLQSSLYIRLDSPAPSLTLSLTPTPLSSPIEIADGSFSSGHLHTYHQPHTPTTTSLDPSLTTRPHCPLPIRHPLMRPHNHSHTRWAVAPPIRHPLIRSKCLPPISHPHTRPQCPPPPLPASSFAYPAPMPAAYSTSTHQAPLPASSFAHPAPMPTAYSTSTHQAPLPASSFAHPAPMPVAYSTPSLGPRPFSGGREKRSGPETIRHPHTRLHCLPPIRHPDIRLHCPPRHSHTRPQCLPCWVHQHHHIGPD